MNAEDLLSHLESLATALGIQVHYESFPSNDWRTSSGACRVKGDLRIYIDKGLPVPEKTSILAGSLVGADLEGVYCPPYVRIFIEQEGKAESSTPRLTLSGRHDLS